ILHSKYFCNGLRTGFKARLVGKAVKSRSSPSRTRAISLINIARLFAARMNWLLRLRNPGRRCSSNGKREPRAILRNQGHRFGRLQEPVRPANWTNPRRAERNRQTLGANFVVSGRGANLLGLGAPVRNVPL